MCNGGKGEKGLGFRLEGFFSGCHACLGLLFCSADVIFNVFLPSGFLQNGGATGFTPPSAFSRNKPRSRSLIRRSSKKAKQQVRDAQPDECSLS